MSKASANRRRPVIEEIEPRILYSAEFSPALLHAALVAPVAEHRIVDGSGEFVAQTAPHPESSTQEVVFVDSATPDYQKLIDDINAQPGATHRLDVVLLDHNSDGIRQISATLATMKDVSAVHLIGHGADGQIELGAATLNFESLLKNSSQIKGWSQALAPGADVLIYGCDVAAHADGRALIDALSRLTGADVAASETPTGAADKGGDWTLEYSIGTIQTALVVSDDERMAWTGLLDATIQIPSKTASAVAATGAASQQTAAPASTSAQAGSTRSVAAAGANLQATIASVPLAFEQNVGQANAQTDFLARGTGYAVGLAGGDAVLAVQDGSSSHVVRLAVLGKNTNLIASGDGLLAAKTNYLVGGKAQWHTGVANFEAVRYDNVYDGIDLRYYGKEHQLEYDFIVNPGADVSAIRLKFEGVQSLSIATNGDLVLTLDSAGHSISFKAPVAYQDGPGGRQAVTSHYSIGADGTVGFDVGAHDASRQLVIDPVLSYGTYFGGTGNEVANGIAVDGAGNVYLTGYTQSTSLLGGLFGLGGGAEVFVAKFSPNLGSLIYSTYVGGAKDDFGTSVALDASGNAYVTGYTLSTDFPTVSAFQSSRSGNQDAFVFKLNAAGSALTYSTYLGGSGNGDIGWAIAVDAGGSAYVTGVASTNNFPTTAGAADTSWSGGDAFVTKLTPTGSALTYSTFIGGSGAETAYGIAVDGTGSAVIVGVTGSTNFPTTVGAFQATYGGGTDAFVTKLNSAGTAFTYSSYLGGSGSDIAYNLALDSGGKIYLTGETSSNNFALTGNALQTTRSGGTDAFVSIIDASASGAGSLVYSTYLGGSKSIEAGLGIGVDGGGRVYISGQTDSSNFSVTAGAFQTTNASKEDAFLIVIDPNASASSGLIYGTYFGGTQEDFGNAGAYSNGKFYLAGDTKSSSGIATTGGNDRSYGGSGNTDAFAAIFSFGVAPTVTISSSPLAYVENAGPRVLDAGFTASDPGITNLSGATIRITSNYANGEDVLAFTNILGITGTWDAATATLALVGSSSVANYQAAVRSVTYENTSENPSTAARSVTIVVRDASLSSLPATRQITVVSVDDAPVNGVPGAQSTSEDNPLVFSGALGNRISIGDVDAGASTARVTLSVTGGNLTLTSTAGLTFVTGTGSGNTTMTFTGTVGNINGALDGLRFDPAANFNGVANLGIVTSDQGNTGSGGPLTATNTVVINVAAVNDAPVGTSNTVTALEDGTHVFSAAEFGFTDPNDSPANSLFAVRITTLPGAGTLTNNGVAVTAGQFVSAVDIGAGLLVFAPAANANGAGYASFSFQVQDNGVGANLDGAARTMAINVSAVNDAPVGTSNTVTALEDGTHVFSAAEFGFTDPNDSPANSLFAVRITTLPGVGTLTNNGVAVTAGQFVSAVNIGAGLLVFAPAANANGAGYASFTFQVQDNGVGTNLDGAARAMTIDVSAVNDAPMNSVPGPQLILQDTALVFSGINGNQIVIADVDAGTNDVRVTLSVSNGVLTLSQITNLLFVTGDGNTDTTMTFTGKLLDINAALDGLQFDPTALFNGGANLQVVTDDQGNVGSGGAKITTSAVAISVGADIPPTIVTTIAPLPYTENDPATPVDPALTISDPDDTQLQSAVVSIVANYVNGQDVLSFTNTVRIAGSWDVATGTLTLTGPASLPDYQLALRSVGYQNLSDNPSTAARGISFLITDGGGNSPISTRTIAVTAVNDAPAGTDNTVTTLENAAYAFRAVDFGFSDAADGSANALNGVRITTIPGAGTVTDNGVALSAGQVVNVADIIGGKLLFTPVAGVSGTGYASFTFQVQDDGGTLNSGVDLDQSPNTMTINVAGINVAPAGTDNTITTLEDAAYTFAAVDFGFNDSADSSVNALNAVMITTMPGAGTLTNNGVALSAGQLVSAADIGGGKLVFTPVANANGAGYASFTFQVQDDGGTLNSGVDLDQSPNTMIVNVTAVNDAPAGTDKTATTLEDTAYTFGAADFGLSDPGDSPSHALSAVKISTIPGVGNLTNNGVAVSAGQLVSAADITAGNLKFNPAANANGTGYASFTFQIQDGGGTANAGVDLDQSPNTMTIDVTAVNDLPVVAINDGVTVGSGNSVIIRPASLDVADSDNTAGQLVFTVSGLPSAGSLRLAGVPLGLHGTFTEADLISGNLSYQSGGATRATDSFVFSVADGAGGTLGPVTFALSINAPPPPAPLPVVAPLAPPPTVTAPTTPAPGAPAATLPVPPGSTGEPTVAGSTPGGASGSPPGGEKVQPIDVVVTGEVGATVRTSPQSASAFLVNDGRGRGADPIRVRSAGPGLGGLAAIGGFARDGSMSFAQTQTLTISASDPAFLNAPEAVKLEVYKSTLANKAWVGRLDHMREAVGGDVAIAHKVVGSTVAISGAMSVGYVIWLLRGGLLLTSLLSSLPAWTVIDPMPVLARSRKSDKDGEDDDPLEKLFGRAKAAVGLGHSALEGSATASDPVLAPETPTEPNAVAEPKAVAVAPA